MENIKLNNGLIIPPVTMSSHVGMNIRHVKNILRAGLLAGYRAIDTARDYDNEAVVGTALKEVLAELGIGREEIILTTKIGNSQQIRGDIEGEIEKSLNNLQTDYIDIWLMHWPYPGYYTDTWKKMCQIYDQTDKVRAIGVANYHVRHFKELENSKPPHMPMINQMEFHPLRTAQDIRHEMDKHNTILEAYAPLCKYIPLLSENKILISLAKKYNKSVGQIILRWHLQNKSIPVFLTNNIKRFGENINIFDFELDDKEIQDINSLNLDYKFHLESTHCPAY